MAGPSTPSLTDIVRGEKPLKRSHRDRRTPKPEPSTAPRPGTNLATLDADLARIEQAAASLRVGLAALSMPDAPPAEVRHHVPASSAGDERVAYKLSEAAKAAGISARVLRREVAAGRIPHRACGRVIIISKAALEAYARGEHDQQQGG
jgi:hypothetical protein